MKSRILTLRSASCLVTRASLSEHDTERTFDVKASGIGSPPARATARAREAGRLLHPRNDGGTDARWRASNDRRTAEDREARARASAAPCRLMAFLPIASRVPMYARLITSLVIDERMPVQPQGAAGRRGRLPRPRTRPHPGRHADHRRARRPRRRRPRRRTSSSTACPTTCSTRSSTSSASTEPHSTATSPRSGA